MRSFEEYQQIMKLHEAGYNTVEIAERTDIPRATVRDVIKKFKTLDNLLQQQSVLDWRSRLSEIDYRKNYAYLFGLYLGDGNISKVRHTYRLRVTLDTKYPDIIRWCKEAIEAIVPENVVKVDKHPVHNYVVVRAYSADWVEMFPQHGEGLKHTRQIILAEWQKAIVDEYPIDFVRGLFHSDGTRIEPVINGKVYTRYQFINESVDIRNLFCASIEKLGLSWTLHRQRVTIAKRQDVAYLDAVIGAKC